MIRTASGYLRMKLARAIVETAERERGYRGIDKYVYSRGMTDWLYSDSKGKIVPIKKKEYDTYHDTDYVFLASTVSGDIVTDNVERVAKVILTNEMRDKYAKHRKVGEIR